jgi:hypothetical protein
MTYKIIAAMSAAILLTSTGFALARTRAHSSVPSSNSYYDRTYWGGRGALFQH